MKCEDCDGTGIIGKDEWVEECLMCDGSGAVTPNRICGVCKGSGELQDMVDGLLVLTECRRCHGGGEVPHDFPAYDGIVEVD